MKEFQHNEIVKWENMPKWLWNHAETPTTLPQVPVYCSSMCRFQWAVQGHWCPHNVPTTKLCPLNVASSLTLVQGCSLDAVTMGRAPLQSNSWGAVTIGRASLQSNSWGAVTMGRAPLQSKSWGTVTMGRAPLQSNSWGAVTMGRAPLQSNSWGAVAMGKAPQQSNSWGAV